MTTPEHPSTESIQTHEKKGHAMNPKTSHSTKTTHHASTTHDPEKKTMKTHETNANANPKTSHSSASEETKIEATMAPAAASSAPKTPVPLIFLQPPPANANIPVAPQGATNPGGASYRSVKARATELAVLPAAVADLQRFADYADVLALSGLPQAQVLQAFDVANQWSAMRQATAAWDAYSQTEEGIAWGTVRSMMERLKPVWAVATAKDPSLVATYPNLATLFSARAQIAKQAASTRRLNKIAKAKGEQPFHGAVGKALQKRMQRAALASASTPPPSPAPSNGAQGAPNAGVVVPTNPGTNGSGH